MQLYTYVNDSISDVTAEPIFYNLPAGNIQNVSFAWINLFTVPTGIFISMQPIR